MRKDALAFLLGVLLVQWAPELPPLGLGHILVAGVVLMLAWRTNVRWCACLLFAIVMSAWRAELALQHRLPAAGGALPTP